MLKDRYGNPLSTTSQAACDAYNQGMQQYSTAQPGAEASLRLAIKHDPNFTLAHVSLAREHHVHGDGGKARAALSDANAIEDDLTPRERSHLAILTTVISGRGDDALEAAKTHLTEYPRDALIASLCLGVFSLIGFSGRPGREAENLAMATTLAPHYGDDPWFLSYLAFAQMETGQLAQAERSIEASLAGNPSDANAAHHLAHLNYEMGETAAGLAHLREWMKTYDRRGIMHCHNAWHIALWSLAEGDTDTMWSIIDSSIDPEHTYSPALNVMTDLAAILYRAQIVGVEVSTERWQRVSAYAQKCFPKPRLAFADVHAALAHAMAGNSDALNKIITDANGSAADIVVSLAEAFQAIAAQNWPVAEAHLTTALGDHARIGGSRAQRDLVEYAVSNVLMRQGKTETARLLLATRRPYTATEAAMPLVT